MHATLGDPGRPLVVIAAGVHGDERAAPWALLSLVGDGLLDPAFRYRLWPCTNPTGYESGTRVSADGLDINRTFSLPPRSPEAATIAAVNRAERAVLSLDMHEDFEGTGFYCYEPAVDPEPPYSSEVIAALDAAGLPVQTFTDDFDIVDPGSAANRHVERGRIITEPLVEQRAFDGWPCGVFAIATFAKRAMTLESPMQRPWDTRLACHRVAVTTVLARTRELERT
jgi:predicted deacylase